VERRFFGLTDIRAWAHDELGRDRTVTSVLRLRGGSKKGVYRLEFDRGPSEVLYVWRDEEDFWPESAVAAEGKGDPTNPFAHASGLELFAAANTCLVDLGVPTPRMTLAGFGIGPLESDIALVEDIRGPTLETLLKSQRHLVPAPFAELRRALDTMRVHLGAEMGKVAAVPPLADGGTTSAARAGTSRTHDGTCHSIVLERAIDDLDDAAARIERLAPWRLALWKRLTDSAEAIEPRRQLSLVHGELGPDHVLVADGRPYLIDIEGLMFFDVEWEHAFLEMRFHDDYEQLRIDGLDDARLRFYRLALHLSLVAGPLRLLDHDFPDRQLMERIVAHNVERTLSFLPDTDV
jgi:hypothetical protein